VDVPARIDLLVSKVDQPVAKCALLGIQANEEKGAGKKKQKSFHGK
jgi:hypothetical protein